MDGKSKKVVSAIVFVTKHGSTEYDRYNKNSEGLQDCGDLPSGKTHFNRCRYRHDETADCLVLVLESKNSAPKTPFDLEKTDKREAAEQEFNEIAKIVTELIKSIYQSKIYEEAIDWTSKKIKIVFLRHFGGGGSRDLVYRQEMILQKWAKGRANFENWSFFLISSVRPEMFDPEICKIPTGDQLTKFVENLENGVFNVRTLQDIQSAKLLEMWKACGWETMAKAVFCIVTEFEGPEGSKVKDFLESLPDDEKFNASPVPLFIVTQNGVRYSNWDGWSFETSFVQVLQNFKQANRNLDKVYVCQLFKDDLLDGFGQIACDDFSGCRDFCYKAFYLNDSLSADVGDNVSKTIRNELEKAADYRERKQAEAVRFLTGEDGLPSGGDAKGNGVTMFYQQVMRELGH